MFYLLFFQSLTLVLYKEKEARALLSAWLGPKPLVWIVRIEKRDMGGTIRSCHRLTTAGFRSQIIPRFS